MNNPHIIGININNSTIKIDYKTGPKPTPKPTPSPTVKPTPAPTVKPIPGPIPSYNSCNEITQSLHTTMYSLEKHLGTIDTLDTKHILFDEYMKFYKIVDLSDNDKLKIITYIQTHLDIKHLYNIDVIRTIHAALERGHYGYINTKQNTPKNNIYSMTNYLEESQYNTIDWSDKSNNPKQYQFRCINNQGPCGSCWAHATTECITIRLAIATGYYLPVDITQMLRCDNKQNDNGCHGGMMNNAMTWVRQSGGITGPGCSGQSYDGFTTICGSCGDPSCNGCAECKPCVSYDYKVTCTLNSQVSYLPGNTKQSIINALQGGPITIAIRAGIPYFQTYTGGVLNWVNGNKNNTIYIEFENKLDHAVLLVGYIKCGDKEYWKIQNSWGIWWGHSGFFYVAAKDGNGDFGDGDDRAYPICDGTYCTPSIIGTIKNKELYKYKDDFDCCPGNKCPLIAKKYIEL
jgi:hypothetical protein